MKKSIVPLVLLFALGFSGQAFAQTVIRDEAGLFSAGAIAKATATADSIKRDAGRNVTVQTLAELPAGAPTKDPELERWVDQRAVSEGVKGVYVFIVKTPGKVYVQADGPTRAAALPAADSIRVRNVIVESFKAKRFDEGLLAGMDEMRIRMLGNKPSGSAARSSQNQSNVPTGATGGQRTSSPTGGMGIWMCVIPLLVVVVGLFLLKRVFSRGQTGGYGPGGPPPLPGQQGYNPNYPGGAPGYGGGGGGFGRGAMGGLLGGLGGAYLYDRFFGGGHGGGGGGLMGGQQGSVGDQPTASSGMFDSTQGEGTDFGGGGGADFGGGGGGGDFGGGGGDFGGGGDSGGGGDF